MKSSLVALLLASVFVVGCAGSSPLGPDSVAASSSISTPVVTSTSGSATPRTFFPPIDPVGISCPSDAPRFAVGSIGMRLDIDFSEVAGARAYEIEIMNYVGVMTRLEVAAPASRAEWYGAPGLYRVRMRTINCGGLGNWTAEVFQTLQETGLPEPEPPVVEPPVEEPPVEEPPVPHCMFACF